MNKLFPDLNSIYEKSPIEIRINAPHLMIVSIFIIILGLLASANEIILGQNPLNIVFFTITILS